MHYIDVAQRIEAVVPRRASLEPAGGCRQMGKGVPEGKEGRGGGERNTLSPFVMVY